MINHIRYRVNFGNGQVHYTKQHTRVACRDFIASLEQSSGAYIEWMDPDTQEWFRLGSGT